MPDSPVRRRIADGRWQRVDTTPYKAAGSAPFRDITRALLFEGGGLLCELRYFEIAPGGHSTLERHEHAHAVVILRGRGRCLVGDRVHEIGEHDLVSVAPNTWHQFRAADDEPLGFLCVVNSQRDRPRLPDDDELAMLRGSPEVADFIRVGVDTGEVPDA